MFPHLAIQKFKKQLYYEGMGVTTLEIEEWACGVEKSRLRNLIWVPHYHHTPINTTCIHQLLTLIHDECLLLGGHIPITYMLIHRLTHFPHEGMNPAKEFSGKTGEKELDECMKNNYQLVKKARRYSILSINDPTI